MSRFLKTTQRYRTLSLSISAVGSIRSMISLVSFRDSMASQEKIFLLRRQIKESRCSPAFMLMGKMSFLVSSKLITEFLVYYCNLFGESQKASQPYYRSFTFALGTNGMRSFRQCNVFHFIISASAIVLNGLTTPRSRIPAYTILPGFIEPPAFFLGDHLPVGTKCWWLIFLAIVPVFFWKRCSLNALFMIPGPTGKQVNTDDFIKSESLGRNGIKLVVHVSFINVNKHTAC